jgi:uncharacterized protein DUF4339
MGYYVSRNGQQSGPYEEAVVRQYLAEGSLFPSDNAREASSSTWSTLGALFPNVATPVAPPIAVPPAYSGPQYVPPSLHWALVLLLGAFTCGIFSFVWVFIQASFVRKIDPKNSSMLFYALGVAAYIGYIFCYVSIAASAAHGSFDPDAVSHVQTFGAVAFVLGLAAAVLILIGIFKLRSSLEQYYNTVEPIGLRLSGVMTFFFSIYYFQHHLTRIATYKNTGYLSPQG